MIDTKLDEQTFLQTKLTLTCDPFFKTFFKDKIVMVEFCKTMLHKDITPDMIEYEDTEEICDGGMTIRHDLFVTIHFPDEDKVIHINMEMQNQYYKGLSLRMENDLHIGKSLKLQNRNQSKKITYIGIWFLSIDCAKHYNFIDYIKECTIKDQYGEVLANNDYIYIINLQKMLTCSIIELQELAKLFIKNDNDKSDFVTSAGKVWYTKMEDMNQSDALKRRAYKILLDERAHKDEIEDAEAEGQNKKAIEVAKKMLDDGVAIRAISKYTGLSIDEIDNLNK